METQEQNRKKQKEARDKENMEKFNKNYLNMEDRRTRVARKERAMEFEREQKMKEINDRMKKIDDMKKQKIMLEDDDEQE